MIQFYRMLAGETLGARPAREPDVSARDARSFRRAVLAASLPLLEVAALERALAGLPAHTSAYIMSTSGGAAFRLVATDPGSEARAGPAHAMVACYGPRPERGAVVLVLDTTARTAPFVQLLQFLGYDARLGVVEPTKGCDLAALVAEHDPVVLGIGTPDLHGRLGELRGATRAIVHLGRPPGLEPADCEAVVELPSPTARIAGTVDALIRSVRSRRAGTASGP